MSKFVSFFYHGSSSSEPKLNRARVFFAIAAVLLLVVIVAVVLAVVIPKGDEELMGGKEASKANHIVSCSCNGGPVPVVRVERCRHVIPKVPHSKPTPKNITIK